MKGPEALFVDCFPNFPGQKRNRNHSSSFGGQRALMPTTKWRRQGSAHPARASQEACQSVDSGVIMVVVVSVSGYSH